MKTEVIMKREIFGREIRQKSKSEFFSATDLVNAGNLQRRLKGLSDFKLWTYLETKGAKEFIKELEKDIGCSPIIKSENRGRNGTTWVHPYLFIDIALAINPKLKIQVYKWLHDFLLKYRNSSGDSYKKMCGALYLCVSDKTNVNQKIIETANKIKISLEVKDWNEATEEQLKKRDKIHENISLLSNVLKRDVDQVVDIAIEQALKG